MLMTTSEIDFTNLNAVEFRKEVSSFSSRQQDLDLTRVVKTNPVATQLRVETEECKEDFAVSTGFKDLEDEDCLRRWSLTGRTGREYAWPPEPQQHVASKLPNLEVQQILRVHFVRQILEDLKRIQRTAQTPSSASAAFGIMKTIRVFADRCPHDHLNDVLLAVHDAMLPECKWMSYSSQQYALVHDLLLKLTDRKQVPDNAIGRALADMETAGFRTIPLVAGYDWFEDECAD